MKRNLRSISLLVLGLSVVLAAGQPGPALGSDQINGSPTDSTTPVPFGATWISDDGAPPETFSIQRSSVPPAGIQPSDVQPGKPPASQPGSSLATDSGGSPCYGDCFRDDYCNPYSKRHPSWYVVGEALFLDRNNNTGNQVLVEQDQTGDVLLSTGDFDFPWETGPRIIVGYCTSNTTAWEISYFGLHDWDASNTVTGNNDLNLPGDLGLAANLDFFNADIMTASYSSEIHNAELNYFWSNGSAISWLAGFRYFHLNEHFNLTSTDFQTGTSEYDIRSRKNLYGGQLGLRVKNGYGRLGWDVTGKAGVYGNDARQQQFVGDFAGFVLRDSETTGGAVGFVGDIGANLVYRLTGNVSLRGGYNVMWLEGVALAPNQLDFTDTPTSGTSLRTGGSAFFHGANAGLIVHW